MTAPTRAEAGHLREPVLFERPSRGQNVATGDSIVTWAPIAGAPRWARVRVMTGGEAFRSGALAGETRVVLLCRATPGIRETDRVTVRDRPHQIRSIAAIGVGAGALMEVHADCGAAMEGPT